MADATFLARVVPSQLGDEFVREVCALYVDGSMSMRRISAKLGVPRRRVAEALRVANVEVSPRGEGRARPQRRIPPALDRDALYELYVHKRLTRGQIAVLLGVPEAGVRAWLRQLDVPMRARGGAHREDRSRVGRKPLTKLYVMAELPADQVGERLGTTRRLVLASAHEKGVPVRPGGIRDRNRGLAIIAALYEDDDVVDVLRRFGVPFAARGGPITKRFPQPVPLTADLLRELYERIGLSTVQIELITGQPAATVRRRLAVFAIPRRPAGGLAPFTRRARQTAARQGGTRGGTARGIRPVDGARRPVEPRGRTSRR